MKDATDEEIGKVVEAVKPTCEQKGVFLLLDDRVELAKQLNVGGVHLGKEDMPPSKARMILGPAAVIGVTANTIADVLAVSQLDIDYFGFGPPLRRNSPRCSALRVCADSASRQRRTRSTSRGLPLEASSQTTCFPSLRLA